MIFGNWRWLNHLSRNTRGRATGRKSARPARPGLEVLEGREVPAVGLTFVNDNWAFVADNDGSNSVTVGDTIRNDNDTINTGALARIYGVDGFGTVTTGSITGSVAGATTINDAIANTVSGGTVEVLEGTYAQRVNVNKSITVLGAQHGVDARTSRGAESVVTGVGNGGQTPFYVTANNVTLDGFTVEGATNGNVFGYGILLGKGTSGAHVLNNIIQENIIGLGLANNPAGEAAVVQHNLFRSNNATGPAGGNAIYSDEYVAGPLANVTIDANRFEGHDDAALNLSATVPGSQSAITFSNNDVVDNGRAAFLFNVVDSTFSNNTVSGSTSAASADFRIYGGVRNVRFTGNLLSGGAGDAIRVTGSNNSGLVVQGNSITGYAGDGLEVVSGAYTGGPLDATGNWWGTNTAAGVAAEISGNIDFTPFLITGKDTSAAPGFQGDTGVAPGEGSVRVKVVGKRLIITGDNLDNLITVEKGPTANSYRITGLAGTQINGRSGSFVFENVTRGIDANLKGGDDMLILDGSATPDAMPGTIKVRTGRGDDLVRLQGVSVKGKGDLGSWSGSDLVQLIDSNFGALAVNVGNGSSTSLLLDNVTVTGQTAVRGGNGADSVRAVDSNLAAVLIKTGLGNDTVRLEGVHATGPVQVWTSFGKDLVTVSNSTFGGPVTWIGGAADDEFAAARSTFAKPVNLVGQGGADRMTATGSLFDATVIANGGSGADVLDFAQGNTFAVAVKPIAVEDVRS
jgi:hypothetical protein